MKAAPQKVRHNIVDGWLSGLGDDDRAEAYKYLSDRNYGPMGLAVAFREDGYDGSENAIYRWRLKNGI